MARHNRRNEKGRRDRWDDAEEWQPPPERRSRGGQKRRVRGRWAAPADPAPAPVVSAPTSLLSSITPETQTCGRCREWVTDELGGRGECLHPGSGILRPWWDTPACPFFH